MADIIDVLRRAALRIRSPAVRAFEITQIAFSGFGAGQIRDQYL
jgi:hypothetical protein